MKGAVVWCTGMPASGKSTFANIVRDRLAQQNVPNCLLDSDAFRAAVLPHLGYSEAERDEFYAILGRLAAHLACQGMVVLVAATANRRRYRAAARDAAERFVEVWLDVPAEECMRRDPKGLYRAAAQGHLLEVPGRGVDYEAPSDPEVTAHDGRDLGALQRLFEVLTA